MPWFQLKTSFHMVVLNATKLTVWPEISCETRHERHLVVQFKERLKVDGVLNVSFK